MYGDSIVATPGTITGSIGVIGGWFWTDGLGKKLGLTSDRVQVGPSADLLGGLALPLVGMTLPERNLDARERGLAQELILTEYDMFVRRVAAARKLDESYVREVGKGHVYPGRVGIEKKIVDRIATLEETVEAARRAAGIKPGRKAQVVEYPKPPLFRMPSFMPSVVRSAFGGDAAWAEEPADALSRFLPSTYDGRVTSAIFRQPGRPLLLAPGELLPDEAPVAH
jgi:protease-4